MFALHNIGPVYVLFFWCTLVICSGQNEEITSTDNGYDSKDFTSSLGFPLNVTSSDVDYIDTAVTSSHNDDETLSHEYKNSSLDVVRKHYNITKKQCPVNSSKPCVVKCCPLGQSIGPDKLCEPTHLQFQVQFFGEHEIGNITVSEDTYHFVTGNPCPYGKYRLEPKQDSFDEFHILRNGSIRAPYLFPYPLMPDEYCLEVFNDDPESSETDVLPLICFKEPPPATPLSIQYILYPTGLLISVPFLVITMLVYCLIPELRDLHGKSLSCHVLCLSVAYIFLAAVQLVGDTMNQELCIGFAFMIHFSFVACFFWLNILCIDTWWNVRANVRFRQGSYQLEKNQYMCYTQLNGEVLMQKEMERKVFFIYSVYAWCTPVLFVVISVIMDLMPTIPSSYLKPHFGESRCWFNSVEAELHYFYGPVGFLITVNFLLFLTTAFTLFKYKWQRNGSIRTPVQTFRMCLMLFGMMGINWVMEVISWAIGGPDYIWYFTDVVNSLQGVIIFCIFVLEPRVRDLIRLQLWPKLSEILCRCQHRPVHDRVLYRSPDKASKDVNDI